jgi:hypothetical protein
MTTIPQFWCYAALLIALLLFLLGIEFRHAFRHTVIPDRDRGMRWFNVVVLFIMVLATYYGTYALELHRKRLLLLIPAYPSARYAPERESFSGSEKWVYVSGEHMDAIVNFYQEVSTRVPYTLLLDKGTTTSRLLFSRDGEQLFLTIASEGDKQILYYSRDGEVRRVTR